MQTATATAAAMSVGNERKRDGTERNGRGMGRDKGNRKEALCEAICESNFADLY